MIGAAVAFFGAAVAFAAPLSQQEACAKLSSAVVSIDAGGRGLGSGFLVSADGVILTANHVVLDPTGQYYAAIDVELDSGEHVFAKPFIALDLASVGQDYAFIKIEHKTPLPFLTLGSVAEAAIGADATIIGYPFSALSSPGEHINRKFCLTATFASVGEKIVPMTGQQRAPNGRVVQLKQDIRVDVIYFQGPSVKGISGSPIIARDTGHVVGIVSTKLTGISPALSDLKAETANGMGGGITISGLAPGKAINDIITVMDDQLANGLGSATGIDDPYLAFRKAAAKKR